MKYCHIVLGVASLASLPLTGCTAEATDARPSTPAAAATAAAPPPPAGMLAAPAGEGTVMRQMTSTDAVIDVSPLDARGEALFTSIACIGDGEVVVQIGADSSATFRCVAGEVSSFMNHANAALQAFTPSITATAGVAWGLTISRSPVEPAS
ncbi:MAG: hypothetical protein WBX27_02795 [Specibacter sp.]